MSANANQTSGFDLYAPSNITWYQVQNNNVSSAAFAAILLWGASTLYKSIQYFFMKKKLIYGLNVAQAAFMLIKTTAATVYVIFLGDACEPRAFFLSVPLVLSIDCMYYIMLVKLLLFTPFKMLTRLVFFLALLAHAIINFIGVAQRTTRLSSSGMCKDVYPLIYKQQYIIEVFLEAFTAIVLIHGLAIKSQVNGQIVSSTYSLLNQLRKNEHLRVFSVLAIIGLKLFLTYYTNFLPNFDHLYLTHGVDQARSAIICWALMRDYRKLTRSSGNASSTGSNPNMLQKSAAKHSSVFKSQKSGLSGQTKSQAGGITSQHSMPRILLSAPMTDRVSVIDEADENIDSEKAGHGKGELAVDIEHCDVKSTETIAGELVGASQEM
ncbi:hypothetical protein BATDEDRAFT_21566 [Batrachochytrium dendrobatidis JAM81]|uniref:G-protein coupled receptors family 1 profile domain-containing protein n=2 Tax=Batrachochytrium dendrobatidis TaxID=109871 RepID=F4NTZ4_BATDJ|nr:uncharacterized protein BATDEDRAFT_21566 [Batrachochytrium dendrobatidis JAM81]EGF83139.1 hypothetical protein BATDEDRAFT_21566 [Batrachochytrium dendrobatidis JAM81]KAJ8325833.1 hypothetical protein O5D80_006020 [Batrachochytrium dendrobatidis]KAK5671717.1 hypothetical protein QVD99_001555 [Batrachochytrium dendrobatidis]OAJ36282.1 hypothetical protein BDEG_20474 [Batrachochytrium dendrobatidis JEL423]|eukprot:XP_006675322.1 hypothetical protein BATDEDRAFT_21566 [Batrachochytrium dendrobatidis JAM81]